MKPARRLGRTREVLERQALVALLEETGWSVRTAAAAAAIPVERLRAKMVEHGLTPPPRTRAAPRGRRPARSRHFRRIAPRTWVPGSR